MRFWNWNAANKTVSGRTAWNRRCEARQLAALPKQIDKVHNQGTGVAALVAAQCPMRRASQINIGK
jgi:hypothetical protein